MIGTKNDQPRTRRRSRLTFGLAALIALPLALTACSSSGKSSAGSSGASSTGSGGACSGKASGSSYKIGFTSDLTSQFGFIGQGLRDGVNAYFNNLNNNLCGVNGHPVDVTVLDDTNQATNGVGNFTKFVTQDNASAVIGFQSSVVAAAVAPLAAQYKVPMLASTVSAALVDPVQPYLFAATVQTANYAAAQMAFAKQLMDKTPPAGGAKVKVASITSSSSAALQQWSDAVKAISGTLGWNLVDQEIVPQGGIDMSAGLTKIVAAKPDIVIMAIGTDPWIIAGMKAQLAGTTFPIVSYDSPAWATVQAVNSDRFYYVSALAYATAAATPDFFKVATAAKLDPNGVYIIRGWYESVIITSALKACGFPCSGEQLQAQLNKSQVDTGGIIQGKATYDATSHEGVRLMGAYLWDQSASAPKVVGSNLAPGTTLK